MDTSAWGLAVSILGVVATVVGLSVAFSQIRKTRTAAEAARDAVTTTEGRLAKAELLQLIPILASIDGALEDRIRNGANSDEIAELLTKWRDSANEVLGVLKDRDYAPTELLAILEESAEEATQVRAELPESADDRRIATKDVRASISSVCGQAGVLKSQLKLKTND